MGLSRRLAETAAAAALAGALLAAPLAAWAAPGVSLAPVTDRTGDATLGWLAGGVEYTARWHLAPVLAGAPGGGNLEAGGFLSLQGDRLALVLDVRSPGERPVRRVLEGDPADLDRLLSSVGEALAGLLPRELGQRLRREPPTRSAEALRLFLRGLDEAAGPSAPELLREALELDPSFAAARWELGLALYSRGSYAEARDVFERCARENPKDASARNNLGMCLARLGEAEGALSCFREVLEMDASMTEARYNLARTLTASGRLTEAEKEYRLILEKHPGEGRALLETAFVRERRGDHPGALEAAAEVGGELGERAAEYYYNLGLSRWEEGDRTGARAAFRLALAVEPSDYLSRLASGVVRYQEEDFRGAMLELEEAARLRGNDPELYRYLGLTLRRLGREQDAMEHFRTSARLRKAQGKGEAVDASPSGESGPPASMRPPAADGREGLTVERGVSPAELKEALVAKQAEIDELRRRLADLEAELGRRGDLLDAASEKAEALELALKTLKVEHELVCRKYLESNNKMESLYPAAASRFARGETEGALALIEELLRIAPGHVRALYLLSTIHTSRGEFALAREALERAAKLGPAGVRGE